MKYLLTYKEIAEKVGVSPTAAHRWLAGNRRPDPETCQKLEKITGVPVLAWLFPDQYNNPYLAAGNTTEGSKK